MVCRTKKKMLVLYLWCRNEVRSKCALYNQCGSQKRYGVIRFKLTDKGLLRWVKLIDLDEKAEIVHEEILYRHIGKTIPFALTQKLRAEDDIVTVVLFTNRSCKANRNRRLDDHGFIFSFFGALFSGYLSMPAPVTAF